MNCENAQSSKKRFSDNDDIYNPEKKLKLDNRLISRDSFFQTLQKSEEVIDISELYEPRIEIKESKNRNNYTDFIAKYEIPFKDFEKQNTTFINKLTSKNKEDYNFSLSNILFEGTCSSSLIFLFQNKKGLSDLDYQKEVMSYENNFIIENSTEIEKQELTNHNHSDSKKNHYDFKPNGESSCSNIAKQENLRLNEVEKIANNDQENGSVYNRDFLNSEVVEGCININNLVPKHDLIKQKNETNDENKPVISHEPIIDKKIDTLLICKSQSLNEQDASYQNIEENNRMELEQNMNFINNNNMKDCANNEDKKANGNKKPSRVVIPLKGNYYKFEDHQKEKIKEELKDITEDLNEIVANPKIGKDDNSENVVKETYDISINLYLLDHKVVNRTFIGVSEGQILTMQLNIPTSFYSLAKNDSVVIICEVIIRKNFDLNICYNGIINEAMTCYMNSLIQTLFNIGYFRKAVFQIPLEKEEENNYNNQNNGESVVYSLQRLFYDLMKEKFSVSTNRLIRSFGWSREEIFIQHDVQEFNLVLNDLMESKMKGTKSEGTFKYLFEGANENYIECLDIDYKSNKIERFYDIQLTVKNCKNIYESLDRFTEVEILENENMYEAEGFGKQRAKKGIRFLEFPRVLMFLLKRFEYNPIRDTMEKINEVFEYPSELDLSKYVKLEHSENEDDFNQNRKTNEYAYYLYSVVVHKGNIDRGHYYAFIKPENKNQWYQFNDEIVRKADLYEVFANNFGGSFKLYRHKEKGIISELNQKSDGNAYLLVYIRKDLQDEILQKVTDEDIPQSLIERFNRDKEYERRQEMLRIRKTKHINIYLFSKEIISNHESFGILPSLLDLQEIPELLHNETFWAKISIPKDCTIHELRQFISKCINLPEKIILLYTYVIRDQRNPNRNILYRNDFKMHLIEESAMKELVILNVNTYNESKVVYRPIFIFIDLAIKNPYELILLKNIYQTNPQVIRNYPNDVVKYIQENSEANLLLNNLFKIFEKNENFDENKFNNNSEVEEFEYVVDQESQKIIYFDLNNFWKFKENKILNQDILEFLKFQEDLYDHFKLFIIKKINAQNHNLRITNVFSFPVLKNSDKEINEELIKRSRCNENLDYIYLSQKLMELYQQKYKNRNTNNPRYNETMTGNQNSLNTFEKISFSIFLECTCYSEDDLDLFKKQTSLHKKKEKFFYIQHNQHRSDLSADGDYNKNINEINIKSTDENSSCVNNFNRNIGQSLLHPQKFSMDPRQSVQKECVNGDKVEQRENSQYFSSVKHENELNESIPISKTNTQTQQTLSAGKNIPYKPLEKNEQNNGQTKNDILSQEILKENIYKNQVTEESERNSNITKCKESEKFSQEDEQSFDTMKNNKSNSLDVSPQSGLKGSQNSITVEERLQTASVGSNNNYNTRRKNLFNTTSTSNKIIINLKKATRVAGARKLKKTNLNNSNYYKSKPTNENKNEDDSDNTNVDDLNLSHSEDQLNDSNSNDESHEEKTILKKFVLKLEKINAKKLSLMNYFSTLTEARLLKKENTSNNNQINVYLTNNDIEHNSSDNVNIIDNGRNHQNQSFRSSNYYLTFEKCESDGLIFYFVLAQEDRWNLDGNNVSYEEIKNFLEELYMSIYIPVRCYVDSKFVHMYSENGISKLKMRIDENREAIRDRIFHYLMLNIRCFDFKKNFFDDEFNDNRTFFFTDKKEILSSDNVLNRISQDYITIKPTINLNRNEISQSNYTYLCNFFNKFPLFEFLYPKEDKHTLIFELHHIKASKLKNFIIKDFILYDIDNNPMLRIFCALPMNIKDCCEYIKYIENDIILNFYGDIYENKANNDSNNMLIDNQFEEKNLDDNLIQMTHTQAILSENKILENSKENESKSKLNSLNTKENEIKNKIYQDKLDNEDDYFNKGKENQIKLNNEYSIQEKINRDENFKNSIIGGEEGKNDEAYKSLLITPVKEKLLKHENIVNSYPESETVRIQENLMEIDESKALLINKTNEKPEELEVLNLKINKGSIRELVGNSNINATKNRNFLKLENFKFLLQHQKRTFAYEIFLSNDDELFKYESNNLDISYRLQPLSYEDLNYFNNNEKIFVAFCRRDSSAFCDPIIISLPSDTTIGEMKQFIFRKLKKIKTTNNLEYTKIKFYIYRLIDYKPHKDILLINSKDEEKICQFFRKSQAKNVLVELLQTDAEISSKEFVIG